MKCNTINSTRRARDKMRNLSKAVAPDQTLWIGELGWSWHLAATLNTNMTKCPAFSSEKVFRDYYQGFLEWDLSLAPGTLPPDMVFYFTMRDAGNGGYPEHFGLIRDCNATKCKMQKKADDTMPVTQGSNNLLSI